MHRACTRALLALASTAAAAGLVAAPASAAKAPKTATFKATLKGNQTLDWSYNRPAVDECTPGQDASGTALMGFRTKSPVKVVALEVKKSNPLYEITNGRPYMAAPKLSGPAEATLEGANAVGGVAPWCPEDGGGEGGAPIECATAQTTMSFELAFVNKGRLVLRGTAGEWNGAGVRNPGPLGGAFYNCPYWTWFGPEYPFGDTSFYNGDVLPVDEPLKEKSIFDKSKRKIVVDYGIRDCWDAESVTGCESGSGDFRGNSNTTAKLVLKRVKAKGR